MAQGRQSSRSQACQAAISLFIILRLYFAVLPAEWCGEVGWTASNDVTLVASLIYVQVGQASCSVQVFVHH
jgi:hypothetical protein